MKVNLVSTRWDLEKEKQTNIVPPMHIWISICLEQIRDNSSLCYQRTPSCWLLMTFLCLLLISCSGTPINTLLLIISAKSCQSSFRRNFRAFDLSLNVFDPCLALPCLLTVLWIWPLILFILEIIVYCVPNLVHIDFAIVECCIFKALMDSHTSRESCSFKHNNLFILSNVNILHYFPNIKK